MGWCLFCYRGLLLALSLCMGCLWLRMAGSFLTDETIYSGSTVKKQYYSIERFTPDV